MDLEGYARSLIRSGPPRSQLLQELSRLIEVIKQLDRERCESMAQAILDEVELSSNIQHQLLIPARSGITAGMAGLGCRGHGDYIIHRYISKLAGVKLDDAGICSWDSVELAVALDGIHSRLSDFPILAGFHAARAALRDVLVMGADPIGLFSDIHLGDDADLSKLLDFVAGVAAVAHGLRIKYTSGSTLRIGGDMVIGDRISGCVGCLGKLISAKGKHGMLPGDEIILTQGNGGGTICTIAIYHGIPELIQLTLNLSTLRALRSLVNSELIQAVHGMTDITNGGLRQDGYEISQASGVKLVIQQDRFLELIHPKILDALNQLQIDPFGISLDMILISAPAESTDELLNLLNRNGLRAELAGQIEPGSGCQLIKDGHRIAMEPRYRESAYTPIKKLVERILPQIPDLESKLEPAFKASLAKLIQLSELSQFD